MNRKATTSRTPATRFDSAFESLEERRLLSVPAALGGTDRVSTDISSGWQFIRQDVSNAQNASVSDDNWSTVSLPHTYNAADGANGGNDYYQGPTWYRKEFTPPSKYKNRRVFIDIGAASIKADVYINGNFVGSHTGAYSGFDVDVSSYILVGKANLIAIRVDNTQDVNVPGYQGDFTNFGGLTRGVKMIAVPKLAVNVNDYGADGVRISQRTNAKYGNLDLDISVRNADKKPASFTLRTSVVDTKGNVVKQVSSNFTTPARKARTFSQALTVTKPHLWNGTADPYLYTAYTQVIQNGIVYDTVPQTVGFRYITIDANGLKLNGNALQLHGVNLHDDKKGVGTAMTTADRERDVKLLVDMGANAVRFAHWQVDQDFYDRMDKAGILVWTEIPLWRRITTSQAFTDNAVLEMRELIRQTQNHPSIFTWGIGNELPDNSDVQSLLNTVNDFVHTEDPSRPTIMATELDYPATINSIPDNVTFNKYYGWYGNYSEDADTRLARFGTWLASQAAAAPNNALGLGEFGAGANINQHVTDPSSAAPTSDPNSSSFHPEEYQAYVAEKTWSQIEASPNAVFGAFVWQFADSGNDNRNEGGQQGINDKGLITYDRKTQKDAYYYYKSQWSNQATLYLTSRRFTDRTEANTPVKVYSNLGGSAELFINGVSQGSTSGSNGVLTWNVTLDAGKNVVLVRQVKNGKTYTDSATWTLSGVSRAASVAMAIVPGVATPPKKTTADDLFGGETSIL